MRVVYYTRPHFLDAALPLAAELARRVELHLLLEVSPEAWRSSLFDLERRAIGSGLVPAEQVLGDAFPPAVRDFWRDYASFNLVVHPHSRGLHPATWRVASGVRKLIAQVQPDAVHLDDVSVRALGLLPTLRRHALVISVHDPKPHSGEATWRTHMARAVLYRSARRFVLFNAAQSSEFARARGISPDRIAVTHLGPYVAYRAWDQPERAHDTPFTVLFFGRLSAYKGLEVLCAAASSLARALPGARVVIAGRPVGDYALPRECPVEIVDGYVPNAQLARLFRDADVVVCPYTEATQSGVVLTAYAFERPVVASAVGGLPEYVRDGQSGLLVPPGDVDALVAALVRLGREPELVERLRQGVRDLTASELSWGRTADDLVAVYENASAHAATSSRRRGGR